MSRNSDLETSVIRKRCPDGRGNGLLGIVADGQLFGLSAGDWTVLISGFGLSALAVFLL
jgi:hypothetical protein